MIFLYRILILTKRLHVLFNILALPVLANAAEKTPEELLSAYERTLDVYKRATFTVHTQGYYYGFALPNGTKIEDSTFQVFRDGERWKYLRTSTSQYPDKGKVGSTQSQSEVLHPGKGSISVQYDPTKKKTRSVVAKLGELPDAERNLIWTYFFGLVTHGYLAGNLTGDGGAYPLPVILRQSNLTARTEQLEGREVWVLEGTGKWGTHTLWLDPGHSYLPRRMVQRKERDHWVKPDLPIASLPVGNSALDPKVHCAGFNQQMTAPRFERINDRDVITGFTFEEEKRFVDGQAVSTKAQVRFSEVNLNPDFSSRDLFRITTPIPNGFPVQVRDQAGINFEWRDGAIVKSVNQDDIASLEGHRFLGGSLSRGLLITAVLAVVALASILGWYWRRTRIQKTA